MGIVLQLELKKDDENNIRPFYFTFGTNTEFGDSYVKIEAPNYWAARKVYFDAIGSMSFAFQYEEEDFLPQIPQYGYSEISLEQVKFCL